MLLALALLLAAALPLAQAWPVADRDEPDTTEEEPEDTADNDEAEKSQDQEQPPDEQPVQEPEGVRRARPRTAEEERYYKQRKTREDPFLNPPDAAGGAAGLYDVQEWLKLEPEASAARYMVQDAAGSLHGYLTIQIELRSDPVLGSAVLLTLLRDYGTPSTLKLSLIADTLQPRRKELLERPAAQDGAVAEVGDNRMLVDYLFDRVTVTNYRGGVVVMKDLRQLPQSFDIDELPLLVRLLDYQRDDWPFEAALTDPARLAKQAVTIAKPVFADVLSAEPQLVPCYQLDVTLGEQQLTWWVQRRLPRRLIKFSADGLTYTLFQYTAKQD
jgi:hypothetical protein